MKVPTFVQQKNIIFITKIDEGTFLTMKYMVLTLKFLIFTTFWTCALSRRKRSGLYSLKSLVSIIGGPDEIDKIMTTLGFDNVEELLNFLLEHERKTKTTPNCKF